MTNAPILYAEDNDDDVFLTKYAFESAKIQNPLAIVSDGRAAIEYLAGTGQYANRSECPLPCLILLDLKMPSISGLEVLKWIRSQPCICTTPVLMLTSSSQDVDINRAYIQGANGYLVKPSTPDGMLVMAKGIKDFWLGLNRTEGAKR